MQADTVKGIGSDVSKACECDVLSDSQVLQVLHFAAEQRMLLQSCLSSHNVTGVCFYCISVSDADCDVLSLTCLTQQLVSDAVLSATCLLFILPLPDRLMPHG